MTNNVFIFQEKAVCITKYGPYSYQTIEEILARKDLERRALVSSTMQTSSGGDLVKSAQKPFAICVKVMPLRQFYFSLSKAQKQKPRLRTYLCGGNSEHLGTI